MRFCHFDAKRRDAKILLESVSSPCCRQKKLVARIGLSFFKTKQIKKPAIECVFVCTWVCLVATRETREKERERETREKEKERETREKERETREKERETREKERERERPEKKRERETREKERERETREKERDTRER